MKDNCEDEQHTRQHKQPQRLTDSKDWCLQSLLQECRARLVVICCHCDGGLSFKVEEEHNKKGLRHNSNVTVSSFLTHMIHVPN